MEIKLRSEKALEKIITGAKEKKECLSQLVNEIYDEQTIHWFKYLKSHGEPFSFRKRMIQEQCAHFILRFLTLNNKSIRNGSGPINVMGLSGPNPFLAVASYMRRGLISKATLFEKDQETYRKYLNSEYNSKEFIEAINKSLLNTTFWKKGIEKKNIQVVNKDYLEETSAKKYKGFLLDHCGKMPDSEEVASYINRKTDDGIFFIEATMIDGRGSDPRIWSYQFEDELYNKNVFVLAKDSYEYKGGTEGREEKYGTAMKTFIWVLEKLPEKLVIN